MTRGAPLPACVASAPEGTVSMRVARSLLQSVEHAGCSVQPLLRAAQVDPRELEDPEARLPRAKIYRLCELAIEVTRDPALGLHWAERLGETAFVPISHLLAHSPSLRHGFEALQRFYPLLSDQLNFKVLEQHDKVTVHIPRLLGVSPPMQQFLAEVTTAGLFRVIRHLSVHVRPDCVRFDYVAPAHQAEYTRVFEGNVLFAQPFTGIVLDCAIMDAPAPHKDADVLEALEALGERRLLDITQRAPYALRVREFLVREGWCQQADMKVAARALNLSVRSLRRRLLAEGKAYNEIADEALAIVAKHLLRDKQRSIKEAAHEMGFSDTSTFHRAFKRWTGTTPSAYRDTQLGHEQRG
jgi:AraC-like DNA-binding protein